MTSDKNLPFARFYFRIYNRGVAGQTIFLNDANYHFLLSQMEKYKAENQVQILAYCLMPTHYHLLIGSGNREQASRFIQRLFNSYTQAFNRQNDRTGTLFESRAKFKQIKNDEALLQVSRYIHLNPVEAGLVKHPNEWKFSNFKDWGKEESPVNSYFQETGDYEHFVLSSLAKGTQN